MNEGISNILALSKKLIYIKSDPDNKIALDEALNEVKKSLKGYNIEEFESNGSKSILVFNTETRPEKFKIILNGHLDVIPGKDFQYKPEIIGDKMYGVGSMDMKSNIACLIEVFKDISNKVSYPIGLQIVTDEEIGGFDGTKFQIDEGINTEFVIAGETTQFNIASKAKGVIWVELTFSGITAHGAYPWRGENAILKGFKEINSLLEKYPNPNEGDWKSSINLAYIETENKSFNKIPDEAKFSLDIRYIPEDKKKIFKDLKELEKFAKINFITNEMALFTEDDNYFIKVLKNSSEKILGKEIELYGANGTSDARHFMHINAKGIEFGPIGGGIGTDEEWVSIESLETYYKILKDFLINLDRK